MTQRLSVTDEIDGDEGTIWMPVQVAGEWLWKRISLDSLAENVRTIVVPAGQSFRIVDNAENPTTSVQFDNKPMLAGGVQLSAAIGNEVSGIVTYINAYAITDAEHPAFGSAGAVLSANNAAGSSELIIYISPAGQSSFETDAQSVSFSGIPTYADNASALAAGLPVGADYNTPAGVRMVVLPPA